MGGGTSDSSSGRAEFAAACLVLEVSLTHNQPIVVLTEGFMTVSSNWVGEVKDPQALLCHSPDGDVRMAVTASKRDERKTRFG